MTSNSIKPIQLDDNTVIYIQVNDDVDAGAIAPTTESLDEQEPDSEFEDGQLPDPTRSSSTTETSEDESEEIYERVPKSKALFPNRHGVAQSSGSSQSQNQQRNPAQKAGGLIKSYSQYLIEDIRNAALSNVTIEKVTLEFGVSMDGSLNAYIASSSVECAVKVAIECKLDPPQAAQTPPPSTDA